MKSTNDTTMQTNLQSAWYIAGKYEVIKQLGSGGFGIVYLVRHVDLDELFALKLLHQKYFDHQPLIIRFKREAAALQRVIHPGTAQLRDFGRTEDGKFYLTMDYCSGTTLTQHIKKVKRITPREALLITIQILEVVEVAHREGIIHQDLKPDNIMIHTNKAGSKLIKVLDFSPALLRERTFFSNPIPSGMIGTPEYVSPEQAIGKTRIDGRSDLYSLGIILYEMLCGTVPFNTDEQIETLLLRLKTDPPPFQSKLKIPHGVQEIVFRALQRKPEDRYKSAQDFREACYSMQHKLSSGTHRVTSK